MSLPKDVGTASWPLNKCFYIKLQCPLPIVLMSGWHGFTALTRMVRTRACYLMQRTIFFTTEIGRVGFGLYTHPSVHNLTLSYIVRGSCDRRSDDGPVSNATVYHSLV